MTFQQELHSWISPTAFTPSPVPETGTKAPSSSKLPLSDKPTLITFLRHCGCPFAEKAFKEFRALADQHRNDATFYAVSHSDAGATQRWLEGVGGPGAVKVIVDAERDLYAAYGLGASSLWHVLNPWSMHAVYRLGRQHGIWNRPTESGSRWQTSGSFAVDAKGVVAFSSVSGAADDIPDFGRVLASVGVGAGA